MARKPGKRHIDSLMIRLRDQEYAARYLSAVLEEDGAPGFLEALGEVVQAHGITAVANKASISRTGLHRMIKREGNPKVSSLLEVLRFVSLKMAILPSQSDSTNILASGPFGILPTLTRTSDAVINRPGLGAIVGATVGTSLAMSVHIYAARQSETRWPTVGSLVRDDAGDLVPIG